MPRTRQSSAATNVEPEQHVEAEEQVDLDDDNDMEETIEEEVEYEEVEEEIEEEEEVEEEVEVEEEEEEEEEEDEEEIEEEEEDEEVENDHNRIGMYKDGDDVKMKKVEAGEDVERKHAELLALPPHGSEVYIGSINHDVGEDDVRRFCGKIGEVTEVRMMKGKGSNENKDYAFVTFRSEELASKAIKELNNSELKGKKVRCSSSQAKNKLFIGNVPRSWGENDIRKTVTAIGPGITGVELLKDPQNSSKNRGFAFVEYYNHACAEYAKERMSNSDFKLDENAPTVSWADPRNAESSTSNQVKAVYVKNLPKDVTEEKLKKLFEHHGKITKVVVPPAKRGQENSRFAFIHFAERSSAMKALKNTEKYDMNGQELQCSLAKPQADQKPSSGSNVHRAAMIPSYQPPVGYGMVGASYGALAAGYGAAGFGAAGFGHPMMYGRGVAPAGLSMMPMLLPDGRIGYVLQQPGAQPHAPHTPHTPHTPPPQQRGGRSADRGSSSGGRRSSDSGHGRGRGRGRSRYSPY